MRTLPPSQRRKINGKAPALFKAIIMDLYPGNGDEDKGIVEFGPFESRIAARTALDRELREAESVFSDPEYKHYLTGKVTTY